MLKATIIFLFFCMLVSLSGAFYTLMQDQGQGKQRTVWLLTLRIALAGLILLLIGYGVWSGELRPSAPWDP